MKTYLCINAWYGRGEHEVKIVKETAKRYLVRCLVEGALFPGGRHLKVGEETYVPKYAIKFVDDEPQMTNDAEDRYNRGGW